MPPFEDHCLQFILSVLFYSDSIGMGVEGSPSLGEIRHDKQFPVVGFEPGLIHAVHSTDWKPKRKQKPETKKALYSHSSGAPTQHLAAVSAAHPLAQPQRPRNVPRREPHIHLNLQHSS